MKTLKTAIVGVVALGSLSALASGFQVDVHSAKATGMAAAVTGDVNDASAIYYNPAGIAQGAGVDLYLGDTVIIPSVSFKDSNGVTTSNIVQAIPPPHAYLTLGIDDMWSFGIGLFEPFGSAVRWPSHWEGSGAVVSTRLVAYDINPTAAVHLGPVRLGAGVQIVRATLGVTQGLIVPDGEGYSQLGLGAWGVGANAGAQFEVVPERLSLGVTYRSAVRLNFSGDAAFSGLPVEFSQLAQNQTVSTRITLPDTASIGIAGKPTEHLRLGFDADYTSWQHFRALTFSFPNPALNQSIAKNWSHAVSLHLGGQYSLSEAWDLRAGVMWDPSAAPNSTLAADIPDTSRINLAAGVGYHFGPFRVDLGYQFLILTSTSSTRPDLAGTYSGHANILSLSGGLHI